MNITEAQDTVTLLRVLQGLHKPSGGPYTPDDVVAACDRLAARASKPLLLTVPVSRSAVVQTLDHLAELDDDETPGELVPMLSGEVEVEFTPTEAGRSFFDSVAATGHVLTVGADEYDVVSISPTPDGGYSITAVERRPA